MADCEYLEECALFEQVRNEDIRQFWIDVCCTAPRQETCARKTLMKAGQPVPETLLPNGTSVDPLDTVILPRREQGVKAVDCEYWEECSQTLFVKLEYGSLRTFGPIYSVQGRNGKSAPESCCSGKARKWPTPCYRTARARIPWRQSSYPSPRVIELQ